MWASNSPLYQQNALTVAVGNKAEKNLSLKWLPQLDLNAQATYQSDVTALPSKIPNITIQQLDKEQYKGTLELVQPVLMAVLFRDKKTTTNYYIRNLNTQKDIERAFKTGEIRLVVV